MNGYQKPTAVLVLFGLLVTCAWAFGGNWTIITDATIGAGSTEAVAAEANRRIRVKKVLFSVQNATDFYFTSASTKISPALYFASNTGWDKEFDTPTEGFITSVGEALNLNFTNDPGCDVGIEYEVIG